MAGSVRSFCNCLVGGGRFVAQRSSTMFKPQIKQRNKQTYQFEIEMMKFLQCDVHGLLG